MLKLSKRRLGHALHSSTRLDERVNDGFYCASGLKWFKRLIEDPAKYVGNSEALATMNETAPASVRPVLASVPSAE